MDMSEWVAGSDLIHLVHDAVGKASVRILRFLVLLGALKDAEKRLLAFTGDAKYDTRSMLKHFAADPTPHVRGWRTLLSLHPSTCLL